MPVDVVRAAVRDWEYLREQIAAAADDNDDDLEILEEHLEEYCSVSVFDREAVDGLEAIRFSG